MWRIDRNVHSVNPQSGAFRLLTMVSPNLGGNDAAINNDVFTASNSGFSSLIYLDGDSVSWLRPDSDTPEKAKVVEGNPYGL